MRRRRKRNAILGAIHSSLTLSRLASPSQATYTETIDSSGTYAKRTIASNGCPNHYNYCTGKDGAEGCGALGEEGTGTEALVQSYSFEVPTYLCVALR